MRIIVIGGGASGMMFSSQYKKKNPNDEVIVFEKSKYVSWAGCPTPYFIADELSFSDVVLRKPEDFIKQGIEVNIGKEVKSVNTKEKYVIVNDEKVNYDKLVIAVGARPIFSKGISLTHAEKAVEIKEKIENKKVKKAVIVGGGFVGIELAESFIKKGLDVSLVEANDELFPMISKDIKEDFDNKIKETNLKTYFSNKVKEFNENNVVLENGDIIDFDILITSIGITPNIDFLDNKLETKNGKILVDEYFKTNIEDVYAIGDSVYNKVINHPEMYEYSPKGDVANKHGYLLASNLSGDKRKWMGTNGSFATSYFDIKIAGTGFTLEKAKSLGYNAKKIVMNASTKNSGFEDYKPNKVEIIYDEDKQIVLGAFSVGYEAVAQFIDQLSIVIHLKTPISEFINIDFCYSPRNASVWTPLLVLYRKVIK